MKKFLRLDYLIFAAGMGIAIIGIGVASKLGVFKRLRK